MGVNMDDVLTTWGREFATAVQPYADEVCGQDGYEVLVAGLDGDVSLARLKTLTDADVETLARAAQTLLEAPGIGPADIRKAVDETLWHWGGED
ncbi:MAG: hypothetical protein K0R83_450 [Caulobacter sp.]|jgi:hypothetical protein|nr:hypothetical protein [Caulobacter sp.]